ncbi:putative phage tail protein [Faecalispora anaeroviscerum]|uniref:putative phage tail protein n=1 Tax=Faecalispora anaeroviscerum TaxID=2991836 RepID=UPI0024BA8A9E|nr:putative phage tail protein [Faecalispora anaeroviscerum]
MFYDHKNDYKAYLIDKLQDVVEIDAIAGVVNIQMDVLSEQVRRMVKNKSVSTCDEAGAQRWEKLLGVSSPLNSTLQARRDALKAKLMTKPPINTTVLRGMVEAYMGLGVTVTVKDSVIQIRYRGESRIADLKPLYKTAYEMIPANLLLDIAYLYVTWDELDGQSITFDQLDEKHLTLTQFERGEWIA